MLPLSHQCMSSCHVPPSFLVKVLVVDLDIALPGRLRSAYTTNLVCGALVGIDRLGYIVWHLPPTPDMVADPDGTLTKGMGTIEQKFNSDGSTLVARQWGAGASFRD